MCDYVTHEGDFDPGAASQHRSLGAERSEIRLNPRPRSAPTGRAHHARQRGARSEPVRCLEAPQEVRRDARPAGSRHAGGGHGERRPRPVAMPVAEPKLAPVYFDSALIAKFYLNEPGREQVRQVARSAGAVVSSGIAVVEVSATFHRKLREGAIELRVLRALQGQFAHDLDVGLWRLAGATEALLREAQAAFSRLDKSVFVRSLDALHLVTAKS